MKRLVPSKTNPRFLFLETFCIRLIPVLPSMEKYHTTCFGSLHPTQSSRTTPLSKNSKCFHAINWSMSHILVVSCFKDSKSGKESGVSRVSTPLYLHLTQECVSAIFLITFRGGVVFQIKITSKEILGGYLNTGFFICLG